MTMHSAVAVKGFIINNKKILLIKRAKNDIHAPAVWEVPGGRIETGENPIDGLVREVKEETGLNINVKRPFAVENFVSDDGFAITMIHFICEVNKEEIKLSEEHTDFYWVEQDKIFEKINPYFKYATEEFLKLTKSK